LLLSVAVLWGCAGNQVQETTAVTAPPKSIERYIEVEQLVPRSQADSKGLKPGDVILMYDGKPIESLFDLHTAIEAAGGKADIGLVIRRGEEKIDITLAPGRIGVSLKTVTKVHRMPDAKIIEGIEPLSMESNELSSFIACARRVLAHFGEQHNYNYLMGISGSAFRLQVHEQLCPSSPDPGVGLNCTKPLLKALGREVEWFEMIGENSVDPKALTEDEMRQQIIKSIDRGLPVIGIDIVYVPEWGIITGYQNGKRDFFCRSCFDGEMNDYNIAEKTPWVAAVLGEKSESLSGEEAVRQSLAIAYKAGTTKKFDTYYSGPSALEHWIDFLGNEASIASISTQEHDNILLGNHWIYQRFIADRGEAVKFLRTYAGVFGCMRESVLRLADIYAQQVELLKEGEENIPSPFTGNYEAWTQEMRNKQAEVLKKVLPLEHKAIALIEVIMEGLGIEPYQDASGEQKTIEAEQPGAD